jgi:D-serine deaminase-like pyridoxal phosphate-dependent protein
MAFMNTWSMLADPSELFSPALVIDRGFVRRNIASMIAVAGGAHRLRPHVKTHKMPSMVRLVEESGITKHKCATIAEAEMIASAGGRDVLLAYPIVGPNVGRLAKLTQRYPETTFRVVVDDRDATRALAQGIKGPLHVLLDLDVGMGRTGIAPGDPAVELYEEIDRLPNLIPDGLHAYDGHVRDPDPAARARNAGKGIKATLGLRDRLIARGFPVPRLVMGGTPTFPIHAAIDDPTVECSPGTCVLHDASYATSFPDLPFSPAAVIFSRVVSRPRPGRICLDLGYKAVAADPVGARVQLLGVPDAVVVGQSEEHLLIETPDADHFAVGTPVLAIPTHVCPTCALYRQVQVVENGVMVDLWDVTARDRVLTC